MDALFAITAGAVLLAWIGTIGSICLKHRKGGGP